MNGHKKAEGLLEMKRSRLDQYYRQETRMLGGGAMSYGMGSRNLTRYNIDLATIRAAIKTLEDEVAVLESELDGKKVRCAVAVVPCDW